MKVKILYIDDEMNNLVSFKAAFRFHFDIFTASTPQEAVMILLENQDIKVIFCDQRMPDITGVDLLEQLKSLFPLPVRIMITGYADIDAVIGAINKGSIFQYIKKPWKEEEVLSAVEASLKYYNNTSLLVTRNQELKNAYSELDKFAYSVSHDIRGPLAGMLTGIDYLQHTDDIDEIRDLLSTMKKSLTQLDDYIVAMHQFYNNQKGQITINLVEFNQIVQENKNIFTVFAEASQIQFETEVYQSEPFYSDTLSIKLIINNLLSNAFKYQKTEPEVVKKVQLSIEVKNKIATITVRDNGIGMKEDDIEKIFELHHRITNQRTGFGFGLYNLKGALLKLNGQIDVQSKLGLGSTFKVTLNSMK